MPVTSLLVLATGLLSVLAVTGSLLQLWRSGARFASGSSRTLALCYAAATTIFGGFVIWLVVEWVQQSLHPGVTGDPGPVVLVLMLAAAAVACFPAIMGIVVMRSALDRRRPVMRNESGN